MSTRPRISFDEKGVCNACRWAEKKKQMDWTPRERHLERILGEKRSGSGKFDCLVPVSGGKDGSYVAYKLKHEYAMNPLCVTVTPALPLNLGEKNLKSFVEKGYNHLSVNVDYEGMRVLNRMGFIKMGFPYYGWLIAIHTIPMKVAAAFNIEMIFYGEDGEVEYGGSSETTDSPLYDVGYQKKIYLEGGYDNIIMSSGLSERQKTFFEFPTKLELAGKKLAITHWSYFENWDPYRNYMVAKEKCGLEEAVDSNFGTFTNFAQNDQSLYSLHTYIMYLKFGFGRANQDACIEIRRGAMTRDQALNLVRLYDGYYPEELIPIYLDYYKISKETFDETLDSLANKELFEKKNGRWIPTFSIK
jgi:N-acetyl sugar amidotransferase